MIKPYDYQRQALDAIVEAFKTRKSILVVMATGLGKTVVSALWAKDEIKKKRKGLFLCHDNGILEQASKEFRGVLGQSFSFKAFYGNESERDYNISKADMVFSSFQTMRDWRHAFFEDEFDFVIVDESHHGQAPTYKDVILYFKPNKLFGMTGTPDREDLKNIREIFGEEVVNHSLEEAIAKGWLAPVEYHILNDNLNLRKLEKILGEVLKDGRRVSVKQINDTIFIRKRDEEIARTMMEFSGSSKKTIVFCENVRHAKNFQPHLPNSATYHYKVRGGKKELKRRLDAFRKGKIQSILAVDKFNEGIDVPDTEVICFLRSTDSRTIFLQQLGRGLRRASGKKKVIILDFVANCERLALIKEMTQRIKSFSGSRLKLTKDSLHVSGSTFDFEFFDEQVKILDLIQRINKPFYPTWQEAGVAAISLGIKTHAEYHKKYKADPRLTSHPDKIYRDFPGWPDFLDTSFYPTWQEAGQAAANLSLKTSEQYRKGYKKDRRLSSNPHIVYKDFPGWTVFLGGKEKNFYPTWQEASQAGTGLGFRTCEDYNEGYKKDRRLPSNPHSVYRDFPGWPVFLNTNPYPTWQEASEAAIELGLKTSKEYSQGYKEDRRLPSNPPRVYKNFPGWVKFLGKSKKRELGYYPTWEEAGKSALALGAKDKRDYLARYKTNPKLPSSPDCYYEDFPGWTVFLGGKKKDFYPTWQEAGRAAIELGVKNRKSYWRQYKTDPKLPSSPDQYYKNFPGWAVFLGGEKKDFYPTWQEAGRAARKLGARKQLEYRETYKQDPKLPSNPNAFYKNFPGYRRFLKGE